MTATRTHAHLMLLALAATALAAVSGCGGSKEISRSELIAKADPICQSANTAVSDAKLTPQSIARVAPGIATAELQASAELAKLAAPSSMAADWEVIVHGFHETGVGMQKAAEAAKSTTTANPPAQSKALRAAELEVFKGQQARESTAARNGFRDCARF